MDIKQKVVYSEKSKYNQSIMILTYMFFSFLGWIVLNTLYTNDYMKWLDLLGWINIIHLLITIILLRRISFRWISFSGYFIILGYAFHFGQLYLNLINYDFPNIPNFLTFFDTSIMRVVMLYTFTVFMLTILGILIGMGDNKHSRLYKDNRKEKLSKDSLQSIRIIAIIMLLITFPVTVYSDIQSVIISNQGNYMDTYGNTSGFIWAVSDLSYTGIVLLILSYSKQKNKGVFVASLFSVYFIFTMLSGRRGHQIIFLLLILYIVNGLYVKINWKNTLFGSVLLILGITFLNSIANYRLAYDKSMEGFIEVFILGLSNNPLFIIISETGATIQTTKYIVELVPDVIKHGNGATIIKPILTIFPNINGILGNIIEDINYVEKLQIPTLGGSYPGELYYNFGVLGSIFAPFIGFFIQRISFQMDKNLEQGTFYKFSFYIPVFIFGLWWIRNSFASIIRISVWNIILLISIKFVLNSITKNTKKAN